MFDVIGAMEGDNLPVSSFVKMPDGAFEAGTSKLEKNDTSEFGPCYSSENCISCNLCSLVCPHAVIRPFLLNEKEQIDAPDVVNSNLIPANIKDRDYMFSIGVSLADCTGCGLCSEVCPGKKGAKAIVMKAKTELSKMKKDEEYKY